MRLIYERRKRLALQWMVIQPVGNAKEILRSTDALEAGVSDFRIGMNEMPKPLYG